MDRYMSLMSIKQAWVGNRDLRVIRVCVGIEDIGEGRWPEEKESKGKERHGELGPEEPSPLWLRRGG